MGVTFFVFFRNVIDVTPAKVSVREVVFLAVETLVEQGFCAVIWTQAVETISTAVVTMVEAK